MDIIDEFSREQLFYDMSYYDLFIIACKTGNLQVAYAIRQRDPSVVNVETSRVAFKDSCLNGQLLLAEWLLSEVPTIDNHDIAFVQSCRYGHVHVAEWLLKVKPTMHLKNAFMSACFNGKLHCAKWLYSLNKDNIQEYATSREIFQSCCLDEQFEVCSWLLKISPPDLTKIELAFDNALYLSNIRAVRWLYKIHPNCIYNIKKMISIPMLFGSNGKLDMVKWMFKKIPFMFNEQTRYYAFYVACEYNKLSIAQLLYSKFKYNDDLFQYALKNAQRQSYHDCRNVIEWMEKVWFKHHKPKIAYLDVGTIETCSICQEGNCEIQTTCNHTFCKTCINTWLQNHNTCPYCRENVKHTPMHTLRLKKTKITLQQLKQMCKENKLNKYSHLKKEQLVQLLRENNIQLV